MKRSEDPGPFVGAAMPVATLPVTVTDPLHELSFRLHDAATRLRDGELEPDATLALIEECSRIAAEAAERVDLEARAALEPLPDLPGQLPLPAAV